MRLWSILLPVIGTCVAAAIPFARYAEKQRDESVAVNSVRQIQDAQERVRDAAGAYATVLATLVEGCLGVAPALPAAVLEELAGAGYVLQMRAAVDAAPGGKDCQGHPLASDYYVAVSPATAGEAAEKAFAGRADRRLFVFVDGIAPSEADIAGGLATPLDEINSFKIP